MLVEKFVAPGRPMLKFPCLCGNQFALDDEMAGGQFQCPRCGRLVDVPLLGEIRNITSEGTYLLDLAPTPEEPDRIQELTTAFSRSKVDRNGAEIDMRSSVFDVDAAVEAIPLAEDAALQPVRPRYDPLTGELIKPIQVSGEDEPKGSDIPMAAVATTLSYATRNVSTKGRVPSAKIFYELLLPHNLVVLLFLGFFHALILVPMALGLFFVAPVLILLIFGMIGHFSNTIEEVGPGDRDEIPRPFRHASFGEDIWHPFVNVALSFMICYGPAVLVAAVARPAVVGYVLAWPLAMAGSVLFPACLMTAATSGTLSNLRPDRVLGVVRSAGFSYLPVLGSYVFGVAFYVVGMFTAVERTTVFFQSFGSPSRPMPFYVPGPLTGFGFMLFGIYILHYCCWKLGLLWRTHHSEFPWVNQRFVKTTQAERTAANTAARAAAKQKYELRQMQRRAAA